MTLPTNTIAHLHRVAAAITDRVGPDGSLDDVCGSRITESALLLSLLQRTGARPDLRPGLHSFLSTARPAHPFEHLVQAAVAGTADAEVSAFLTGFTHPTGERKKLLLAAVLALAADTPFPHLPLIPRRANAIWTDVALCAFTVIDGVRRGQRPAAAQAFLADNLHTGTPMNGIWQGNLLTHLLALHALAVIEPRSPLIPAGVTAMAGQINPDGGIPFIAGQDIWITALAGTELLRSGIAGPTVEQMGSYIAGRQLADGGWGYTRTTTQSDVDDTSRCMTFLAELDSSRYRCCLVRARAYLAKIANADGGFPTYVHGAPSEPDLTAGALMALAQTGPSDALTSRAASYLAATQHSDGSFTPSWTRSTSSVTAHVIRALRCARQTSQTRSTIDSALAALAHSQNIDGGWGHTPGNDSDVISTAHAATALPTTTALEHAVTYLMDHAGPDAIPDQVGPRPIPYDYPILTDIHVLAALRGLPGVREVTR